MKPFRRATARLSVCLAICGLLSGLDAAADSHRDAADVNDGPGLHDCRAAGEDRSEAISWVTVKEEEASPAGVGTEMETFLQGGSSKLPDARESSATRDGVCAACDFRGRGIFR